MEGERTTHPQADEEMNGGDDLMNIVLLHVCEGREGLFVFLDYFSLFLLLFVSPRGGDEEDMREQ